MKKETVKLVFIVLVAFANILLVYTLLSNHALLEQKRDFNNLVEGNEYNVVKVVKDKLVKAIGNDDADKIVVIKPKIIKKKVVARVKKSKQKKQTKGSNNE